MPRTEVSGRQIRDESVGRDDLDVTTVGQAVVRRIVQGANVNLSSTGADAGTGDVTVTALHQEDAITYQRSGTLSVLAGRGPFRWPWAVTVLGVSAAVDGAPAGSSILIDLNKNGTTMYTTQSARPSIAAGAYSGAETVPAVTAIAAGDITKVDIDQVGSTTPGSDLGVTIRYRKT